MGFISWLFRGFKLILLAILCGAFLFEGVVLSLSGLLTNNSSMMYTGIVLFIIGTFIGLYIVWKYDLISEWREPKFYREPYRKDKERVIVVKEREKPYYIGPGPLTEMAQREIPKGGLSRALGIRKDGSVVSFGLEKWGFSKKRKRRY